MGYFPPGFLEAVKSLALTCLLFLGPLFEGGIAEGAWRDWIRLRGAYALLRSWIGYRNIVAV
jgi:prenyl protein peptidase